ncbi:MAG: PDZ domain-containing protein [Candidatus Neomarinimicrobiota bacterium]
MLRMILSSALMLGILSGQQKQIIIKKQIDKDQKEINTDVNIYTENNEMTIKVVKDGEKVEYKVSLDDEKELQKIKSELAKLDIDLEALARDEDNLFTIRSGGFLGVQIQDLSPQLRKYFSVKGDLGVLVSEVVEDSPAEKAGILAGDIITRIGKKKISSSADLTRKIRAENPDSKIQLTLIRKGRKKTVTAVLGTNQQSFSWMGRMPGMKKHFNMKMKGDGEHNMHLWMDGNHEKDVNFYKFSDNAHGLFEEFNSNSEKFTQLRAEMDELRKEFKALKEELKSRP